MDPQGNGTRAQENAHQVIGGLLDAMLLNFSALMPKNRDISGKAGGYPEEIFLNITPEEKEKYSCAICYMIVRDVHQCRNGHLFCHSCILAWTSQHEMASARCPMCRCMGMYYRSRKHHTLLKSKTVKCLVESCEWTGLLSEYKTHRHTSDAARKDTSETKGEYEELQVSGTSVNAHVTPSTQGELSSEHTEHPLRPRGPIRTISLRNQMRQAQQQTEILTESLRAQLEQRQENIASFHRERERARSDRMNEVHSLEARLGRVSNNLGSLLGTMETSLNHFRDVVNDVEAQAIADETNPSQTRSRGIFAQNPLFPIRFNIRTRLPNQPRTNRRRNLIRNQNTDQSQSLDSSTSLSTDRNLTNQSNNDHSSVAANQSAGMSVLTNQQAVSSIPEMEATSYVHGTSPAGE